MALKTKILCYFLKNSLFLAHKLFLRLEFVGQNIVSNTPADIQATYFVPEDEQIEVRKGDYLGLYYGQDKHDIGYVK